MVEIPHNVLDFADALHLLAQSQSDVSEIVTKWDLICDTTTARTVTVNINGTTMEVDNLAKIRQDLVSGLSLDNPTVASLKLLEKSGGGYGMVRPTHRYSVRPYTASNNLFGDGAGQSGMFESVYNVARTLAMPTKSLLELSLYELPSVMVLGWTPQAGTMPVENYEIRISAPDASYAEQGAMANSQYYATVKFANRNLGTTAPIEYRPVTIKLCNATGGLLLETVISPLRTREFMFWAAPGQDSVNLYEIIPDTTQIEENT